MDVHTRRILTVGLLVLAVAGSASLVLAQSPATSPAASRQPAAAAPRPGHWHGYANAAIAAHARRVGAQEQKDERLTCEGDVNDDGNVDVGVVYTLDGAKGSTGWTQHLIVLAWTPQGAAASGAKEIGGQGTRRVERCGLATGAVEMATKEWAPDDPACCPSKAGEARVGFRNGTFIEAPAPKPSGP